MLAVVVDDKHEHFGLRLSRQAVRADLFDLVVAQRVNLHARAELPSGDFDGRRGVCAVLVPGARGQRCRKRGEFVTRAAVLGIGGNRQQVSGGRISKHVGLGLGIRHNLAIEEQFHVLLQLLGRLLQRTILRGLWPVRRRTPHVHAIEQLCQRGGPLRHALNHEFARGLSSQRHHCPVFSARGVVRLQSLSSEACIQACRRAFASRLQRILAVAVLIHSALHKAGTGSGARARHKIENDTLAEPHSGLQQAQAHTVATAVHYKRTAWALQAERPRDTEDVEMATAKRTGEMSGAHLCTNLRAAASRISAE